MKADETFPEHNYGDAPLWWGDDRCEMSGKPSRRREGRAAGTWWQKYTLKRPA